MLRLAFIVLLLANVLFYAWNKGAFAALGLEPDTQSEPIHVRQQLRADALRIQTDKKSSRLAQANNPVQCLVSGLVAEPAASALQAQVEQVLPAGSYALERINSPGRWLIYMGRYPSAEAAERKKEELARLRVPNIQSAPAGMEPGISLGTFTDAAQAQAAYKLVQSRGVRTARLITEQEPQEGVRLRVEQADDALREAVVRLKPAMGGQEMQACG